MFNLNKRRSKLKDHRHIAEVADELDCHPNTIRNFEKRGLITFRRDKQGHRVFTEKDVEIIERLMLETLKRKVKSR